MNCFRLIYRILNFLRAAMNFDEFDAEHFNAGYFGVSCAEFANMIALLLEADYIKGIVVDRGVDGYLRVNIRSPGITIPGLEYLNGNKFMKLLANKAKGI